MQRTLLLLLLVGLMAGPAGAQSVKRNAKAKETQAAPAAPAPQPAPQDALYQKVAQLDAEMFAAFNAHDANKLMSYFADNVEFYHDKGGLAGFSQTKQGFANMFAQSPDITRTLVPGSLEVYPIKDYGAMHIGQHRFCHQENGREDCGTFKFVMLWQQQAGTWKITRVVSYGH